MKQLCCLLLLLCCATAPAAERVVGYYPSWIRYKTPAEKIRYQDVTVIAHSFIWPKADGTIDMYSDLLYPELISRAHAAGVKVIIAIGGGGQNAGFPPMAASAALRKLFIEGVIALMQKQGYDGIDLDWEYPNGGTERSNFTLLVNEFRAAFNAVNPAWTVSFVVPSGQYSGNSFNYSALRGVVDWIGCMTYDMHGEWTAHAGHNAPLYAPAAEPEGSIDVSVKFLLRFGIPKEKLLIGVPFYGRQFKASALYAAATGGGALTYADIMAAIRPNWTYHWDEVAKVPWYLDGTNTLFTTVEDTTSVRLKCEYVRANRLGGLIIWALGQDNIGTRQPLLQTVGEKLTRNTTAVEFPAGQRPAEYDLLACYPNPCNSATKIRFSLQKPGEITLRLYDLCGREVKWITGGSYTEGMHEVTLAGAELPSGIYWIRLDGEGVAAVTRVTILR